MNLHWHALRTFPRREISASLEVAARGFSAYVPTIQRHLAPAQGGGVTTAARFPGWIFARFDAQAPGWQDLTRDEAKRAGVMAVYCTSRGNPVPVPDAAINAMKSFKPPAINAPPNAKTYLPGCDVTVYLAPGVPVQAVFLGYRKRKAKVRLWILGRETETEVPVSAIEEPQAA